MNRADNSSPVTLEWLGIVGLIAVSTIFYAWFGWSHFPRIQADQGWFLQVSQRVAQGDVLYRDVLWMYGPLPVMLMSALMRLARNDLAYYSALNVAMATGATMILYALHRYVLNWRRALIATLFVTLGCGTYLLFLNAYTPGIASGVLGVLLGLWGILGSGERRYRFATIALIALGVALSWLSKPEYAFASFGLSVVSALGLSRVRVGDADNRSATREILGGLAGGLGIAGAVYTYFAIAAGWANVWAGLSGYERGRFALDALIGYNGLDTWLKLLIAALAILAARSLGAAGRTRWQTWVLFASVVALFVAFYSGWLARSLRDQTAFDLAGLWQSVRATGTGAWILSASAQVYLAISLGVALVCVRLLARWVRRKSATRAQWTLLVVLVGVLLVQLRNMLIGGLTPILGLVLFLALLDSEFPKWSWRRQPVLFGAIVGAALIVGVYQARLDLSANARASMATPYGSVKVYQSSRDFLGEVAQYVNEHSQREDSIAVLGPLAGVYYLTERRNPLRQDYQDPGLGENESEARDFIARLDADAPALLLVPQGAWSVGILNLRNDVAPIRWTNARAFRGAASQVEEYLASHYRFDRFLGRASSIELAVFKRAR